MDRAKMNAESKNSSRAYIGREQSQPQTDNALAGAKWKRIAVVVYFVIAALLFAWLTTAAARVSYFPVDLALTRLVQSYRTPLLDTIMRLVGLPGFFPQTIVLNALFVVIVWACRMKRAALSLVVVGSFTGITGSLFRHGIDRLRPSTDLVWVAQEIEKGHFSYPSGHVIGFTAILGLLMYLGLTELRPTWHRNLLLALYAIFIVLVGLSRIYEGEHWPSDVLAGYLYGSLCLILLIAFYRWLTARAARGKKPGG